METRSKFKDATRKNKQEAKCINFHLYGGPPWVTASVLRIVVDCSVKWMKSDRSASWTKLAAEFWGISYWLVFRLKCVKVHSGLCMYFLGDPRYPTTLIVSSHWKLNASRLQPNFDYIFFEAVLLQVHKHVIFFGYNLLYEVKYLLTNWT